MGRPISAKDLPGITMRLLVWNNAREYQIKNNVRDDALTPKGILFRWDSGSPS